MIWHAWSVMLHLTIIVPYIIFIVYFSLSFIELQTEWIMLSNKDYGSYKMNHDGSLHFYSVRDNAFRMDIYTVNLNNENLMKENWGSKTNSRFVHLLKIFKNLYKNAK